MKKWLLICTCSILFVLSPLSIAQAEQVQKAPKQVTLTENQKNEINKLYQKILADRKELLNKYVEYGAITEAEAKRMAEHFEKQYEMIQKHDFQLPPHHFHHKHHHKHKHEE